MDSIHSPTRSAVGTRNITSKTLRVAGTACPQIGVFVSARWACFYTFIFVIQFEEGDTASIDLALVAFVKSWTRAL